MRRGSRPPAVDCGRVLVAVSILSGACATGGARGGDGLRGPVGAGWQRAVDGDDTAAAAHWQKALAAGARDAVALFGRATVAFERGESAPAFESYLRVLELAAQDQPGGRALAAAAAAHVRELLDELVERRAAETRLLDLPRAALPWPAQVEMAELAAGIARRRADAPLLAAEARRAGCVQEIVELAMAGRLPHLDLDGPGSGLPGAPPHRVVAAGCRLLLPVLEGHPGVRLLRAAIDVPAGAYDLALSFSGPALLRVDGGAWHRHGSPDRFGPRWSAARATLRGGPHDLEVRLGSFGGSTELTVLALPVGAAGSPSSIGAGGPASAVEDLAGAVAANLAGDADEALERAARLADRSRFALGLAAAARVALQDPSRPASIGRDAARNLFRRAVSVDGALARVWRDLALLELGEDRPREAAEAAERALRAAPHFRPAALVLSEALRARGLERQADRALARAVGTPAGGCVGLDAAVRRARELGRDDEETALLARLERCDAQSDVLVDRLRARGDLAGLERALRARLPTSPDPSWPRLELASVLLARGKPAAAVAELEALLAAAPRDTAVRIRLADALIAAGDREKGRLVLAEALRLAPTRPEVRQATRAIGLPLPMDPFRLDGGEVIAAFERAARHYDAPAVMVLDRAVERVFADGARLVLTHDIVLVQSKDAMRRWGEVNVPEGAEVLTLRTRKPDGTVHEPEEIVGKSTISAPDLDVGDYVEWETLESRDPADAFAPGFLGDRFYFQSSETPLDRSEYLLVTPAGVAVAQDRRAGAPRPTAEGGPDGTRILRFLARQIPQLFPERASVPAIEWIPSVRASSGVSIDRWSRYLADQLHGVARASPALRRVAQGIAAPPPGDRSRLPARIASWVAAHIEPEGDLLEPATFSLARGRGNRTALILALCRILGVPAQVVFARPLTTAARDAAVVEQELDDFAEVLVRFPAGQGSDARFVHPRLRRAPFGYLPPTLEGAPALVPGPGPTTPLAHVATAVADRRRVQLAARLGPDGRAAVEVTEELQGWPAIEWVEMMDRAGEDRARLRQDFEQHGLSQNFPGAILGGLRVDLREGGQGGVLVRYGFTHPELALRDGNVLKLAPTFFRAQPGHRYAAESDRRTTLLLGFDVPLDLEARLVLPPGARLIDAGDSGTVATGPGAAVRFAERREVQAASSEVVLRRQTRLPLVRVQPADYPAVAAQLRRVDPLEQSEIRLEVPPPARSRPAAAGGQVE
jgi:cellulose synthase operon protein C